MTSFTQGNGSGAEIAGRFGDEPVVKSKTVNNIRDFIAVLGLFFFARVWNVDMKVQVRQGACFPSITVKGIRRSIE